MKNYNFKHIREISESQSAKHLPGPKTNEITFKPRHLNKLLDALEPGKIIVLGGRPGMGKTSIAIQLASNSAVNSGKTVGYCTLELSSTQLTKRMMAFHTNKDSGNTAVDDLLSSMIYLLDTTKIISDFEFNISTLNKQTNIDLLIIDYFQLLPNAMKQDSSLILARLKKIAEEKNIAILILSQLSKTADPYNPKKADLACVNDPDNAIDKIFFLFRPSYYDRNSNDHNTDILQGS